MKKTIYILLLFCISLTASAQTESKFPFSISKLEELYAFHTKSPQAPVFAEYILIDIDEDGKQEVAMKTKDGKIKAVFSDSETDLNLIAWTDKQLHDIYLFKGTVCSAGNAGTDNTSGAYKVYNMLEGSAPVKCVEVEEKYDPATHTMVAQYIVDGEIADEKIGEKLIKKIHSTSI